jgi:hypothetical protein
MLQSSAESWDGWHLVARDQVSTEEYYSGPRLADRCFDVSEQAGILTPILLVNIWIFQGPFYYTSSS